MSRPFQCIIVDGRKEFLKSEVLHQMLWEYLVTYLLVLAIIGGHIDVKYGGARLFVILKTLIIDGIYVYILDALSTPLLEIHTAAKRACVGPSRVGLQ